SLLVILIAIAFYFGVIIVVGSITNYRPEPVTELNVEETGIISEISDTTFTLLSWNIGYGGLGADMDFFYDGGTKVKPDKNLVSKYTSGIFGFLQSVDSIDFILLQEVDKNSARTSKLDETKLVESVLSDHTASFGTNYDVWFVPIPLFNPLGKIEMGQMILSKYHPAEALRYSYFSKYAWPKRLFMLDRCFLVSRFSLANGKEMIVLNTHNSAYDDNGKLREMEMPLIRDFMIGEFEKGNYVVAGGDWNQNPPGYNPEQVDKTYPAVYREKLREDIFPPDWQFIFDPSHPTNREIDAPLTPGKTEVTIIDYFILSPNIKVEQINVVPLNFQNSDHNPVLIKLNIK
ncbi:MAG: hypothetical protein JXR61_08625, partial [Prolixibacteraceae bacterium]|nr:hypothetical protein [Prolixibacteraceae bacterium]